MVGTLVCVLVAVLVGSLFGLFGIDVPIQIMAIVFFSALIVQCWTKCRVAMWTAPIVFMNEAAGDPLITTGLERGAVVFIGALISAILHWIAQLVARKPRILSDSMHDSETTD